jgi:hypothetical protein
MIAVMMRLFHFYTGPFMWGTGVNAQSWADLLRIWGVSPDSEKWREVLRDLDRGQVPWNSMGQVGCQFCLSK